MIFYKLIFANHVSSQFESTLTRLRSKNGKRDVS